MKKDYIKVEGHNNLVRDPVSGAIININSTEKKKIQTIRAQKRKEREEIQQLKNDVGEIMDLLKQLLEKR